MRKKTRSGLTVCKTISMPLDLILEVANESEVMSKDFSETTAVLIRIGILVRKDQRARDEKLANEEARKAIS